MDYSKSAFDTKMAMSAYVKQLRKYYQLTQQELADRLAMSRITIQNIEKGNNFTIDAYLVIIEHFKQCNALYDHFELMTTEYKIVKSLY